MKLHVMQLPCDRKVFEELYQKYVSEMEAHKETKNVPAPLPEYDLMRSIYESGEPLEIFEDFYSQFSRHEKTVTNMKAIELASKREVALDAILKRYAEDAKVPKEVLEYLQALGNK